MENFLPHIKHFSAEPAVRNLYRNQENARLGEQFDYRKNRDQIADARFNQQWAQQNEDRAYNRKRQLKQDRRADQLYNIKLGEIAQAREDKKQQDLKDKIAAVVYASKTPEIWGQNLNRLRQKGVSIPSVYDDFGQRESILAEYAGLDHVVSYNKMKGGEKPTSLMQNLDAAGLEQGTPEFRDAVLGNLKRDTTINNVMPGSGKGTNKLTEKLAEQAASVFDQANAAQDLAGKYGQINELAQNPNVRTGTFGNLEASIKKFGNTVFGAEFDGLPELEQITKVGDMLVGDIRKLQGDTRMSDADRRAYRAIPPNLGDSKAGIALAAKLMQKTAQGMSVRQQKLSELLDANGGHFDSRVWAKYNQFVRQTPLITREDIAAARKIAKETKQSLPHESLGLDKQKIDEELRRRGVIK